MNKLLIANRGEIAVRIARTAKKLGLKTVAVYSDADACSPHITAADESFGLGGSAAADSYLHIEKILSAARLSGADAIHPGYGFLAEDAGFAEQIVGAGMIFVGPAAEQLRGIGNKDSARKIAKACGVPVPEGYDDPDQSPTALASAAEKLGFPLLIKAVAGGGGRGMRLVHTRAEFADAASSAQREAQAFFGDGRLILEQYLAPARHIEIQLIADRHGNVCHLFERDCSLQRRYQKIIEESPARNLSEKLRSALFEAAVTIAQSAKLTGAATAEFLVPRKSERGAYFFLEVNPRIQVEHPVTELVTGKDIVELQLRIARGEALPFSQSQVTLSGHAIEARVCAELPFEGFRPSSGRIERLDLPQDSAVLRLDHALAQGLMISTNYDSLLLKAIGCGKSAGAATKALLTGLKQLTIGGPETNLAFLTSVLESAQYGGKEVPDTTFLDLHLEQFVRPALATDRTALARRALASHLAAMFLGARPVPRLLFLPPLTFNVTSRSLGESWTFEVELEEVTASDEPAVVYSVNGKRERAERSSALAIARAGRDAWNDATTHDVDHYLFRVERALSWLGKSADASAGGSVYAPLPGTIIALKTSRGARVKAGDPLVVIESMKMEHALRAPKDGEVIELRVALNEKVREQQLLLLIG